MNTHLHRFGLARLSALLVIAATAVCATDGQAGSACCATSAPPPVAPIPASEYLGWTNAFRLQNDRAEAVFVPAIGRLVHFARRPGDASPFRLERWDKRRPNRCDP